MGAIITYKRQRCSKYLRAEKDQLVSQDVCRCLPHCYHQRKKDPMPGDRVQVKMIPVHGHAGSYFPEQSAESDKSCDRIHHGENKNKNMIEQSHNPLLALRLMVTMRQASAQVLRN